MKIQNKPQTLLEAINKYIEDREFSSASSEDLKSEKKLLKKTFVDQSEQTSSVENTLGEILVVDFFEKINKYVRIAEEKLRSYSNDKEVYREILVRFFSFLRNHYPDENFDIGFLEEIRFFNKIERLNEILKYTHEGNKTRDEIAGHFVISKQTLVEDINSLKFGCSILGQKVKIEDLERGTNLCRSTIHPIYLPLDLLEVFVLTTELKRLSNCSGSPYSEIMGYLAEAVYDQLSDYGKRCVNERGTVELGKFDEQDPDLVDFRNKNDFLGYLRHQHNDNEDPKDSLAYAIKSGELYEVEYFSSEKGKTKIKARIQQNADDTVSIIDDEGIEIDMVPYDHILGLKKILICQEDPYALKDKAWVDRKDPYLRIS